MLGESSQKFIIPLQTPGKIISNSSIDEGLQKTGVSTTPGKIYSSNTNNGLVILPDAVGINRDTGTPQALA